MTKLLRKLWKDEEGASLIEYVLIAGLISIMGYAFMKTIGGDLNGILDKASQATTDANTTVPTP